MSRPIALALILLSPSALPAAEDGFVSLFNGRDLSGWINVNCAPETWTIRDGMIHCTGLPTGALRTKRPYENFILQLDWRHLRSGGNSGVFIWGTPIAAPGVPFLQAIEVQVLDHGFNIPGKNEWYTTHGDVFPIHGSTMEPFGRHNGMRSFPSEERSNGTPEWNHYLIQCTNGVIRLQVNGKEVSGGANCIYRKGYVGLESEGAPIDFRNIRIKELPSSGAREEFSAPLDQHWHSLFTGLDFRGWQTNSGTAACWRVAEERLTLRAGDPSPDRVLWRAATFGKAEIIVDARTPKPPEGKPPLTPEILLGRSAGKLLEIKLEEGAPGVYTRYFIKVKGDEVIVNTAGTPGRHLPTKGRLPARWNLGLSDSSGGAEFLNLYVRDP